IRVFYRNPWIRGGRARRRGTPSSLSLTGSWRGRCRRLRHESATISPRAAKSSPQPLPYLRVLARALEDRPHAAESACVGPPSGPYAIQPIRKPRAAVNSKWKEVQPEVPCSKERKLSACSPSIREVTPQLDTFPACNGQSESFPYRQAHAVRASASTNSRRSFARSSKSISTISYAN